MIANGGLPLILSAMKKYDDDSEMQDSACRAIGSLAACGKSPNRKKQSHCICDFSGVW